jgi:hypothetical protein
MTRWATPRSLRSSTDSPLSVTRSLVSSVSLVSLVSSLSLPARATDTHPLPSDLPSEVIVPTATEARGLSQTWAVRDGRLWVRPDGEGGAWEPLHGTGRPRGPGLEAYADVSLVAVAADEDGRFAVVDSNGIIFHYEGSWNAVWGLPFLPFTQGTVTLPFPVSSLREGRLVYSQRHKTVGWSEDARGQQFYWGSAGTTSLYILSEDGRRIYLLDPWLPPDTTRELMGPKDGTVAMASLAASASTMLAIAPDGAIYTHAEDYDSNGGTPFYLYAYDDFALEGLPGTDPRSETQTHALPVEPWQRQPDIVLVGQARLSRRIAVEQTGTGHVARRLRVVGDDENGVRGVYEKSLEDASWSFVPRDIVVGEASWLPRPPSTKDEAGDGEPTQREEAPPSRSYAGLVRHGGRTVAVSTHDFWFHRDRFHIELVDHGVAGGAEIPLVVHTADLWTLFREANAADDPLAPRQLKATIQVDPTKSTPALQARARDLLGSKLGQVFGFAVVVDGDELVLIPVDYPWGVLHEERAWVLRATPSRRRISPLPLFSRLAQSHVDLEQLTFARCATDDTIRRRADEALKAVLAAQRELASRASIMATAATAAPLATLTMDALSVLTTARWTVRELRFLKGLEQHLPALTQGPAFAYARRVARSQDDFDDVTRRLRTCVTGQRPG